MEEIYLMPKKMKAFDIEKNIVYLDDIYHVYPKVYEENIKNLIVRKYEDSSCRYDVIHLGEIIELIKKSEPTLHIDFLQREDIIIYFEECKKDKTKYIRVFLVSMVVLMGSIMGIMNFHADVNMDKSQAKIVNVLTKDAKEYLPYFQIPYSLGIGIGVALFFNKIIPTYSRNEPSPLDLRVVSLNKEIENQLKGKEK